MFTFARPAARAPRESGPEGAARSAEDERAHGPPGGIDSPLASRRAGCENARMKKHQLFTRISPESAASVISRFNDGELSVTDVCDMLGVGRTQAYNLRTKWLASGRSAEFLGTSGGNRMPDWPSECVGHLRVLIEASRGEDMPNYELYADELERKFGFVRDRSNVRRFCENNLAGLLGDIFPFAQKKRTRPQRRWSRGRYGELYQHDSTPFHIWGPPGTRQTVIISIDDATRRIMAFRVCERETLLEHYAMLEDSFTRYGVPESIYTDGFTMFGREGEDLTTQFGRMCRAFGIVHMIAPTPQAKGKVERSMRTFQHRLLVVFRAEGVDSEARANELAGEHLDFWNSKHLNEETGAVPDVLAAELASSGKCVLRPAPNENVLRMFLSRHEPRGVEGGCRIDFMGTSWKISPTLKKSVWLAIRPKNAGFYVFETRPDPTKKDFPRMLGAFRF